ncbi:MAG: radical SAM protein [Tannerella sp.]|nr:radical SAM protein [Tannerella sp.]
MNRKILLISANVHNIPYPVYPIGISYLKSYLHTHLPDNYDIITHDLNTDNGESLNNLLSGNDFLLVGISLRNFDDSTNVYKENIFVSKYKDVITRIRRKSNAPIVIGGTGFSVFPEILFDELKPDFGIKGEGEESLKQLIAGMSNNTSVKEIEGLVYKDPEGNIQINEHKKYITAPELRFEDKWVDYYWREAGMLNVQTKRGCPYSCIFCSYPLIDGKRVRTLDAVTVVHNIEELYFSKGVSYFFFTDSLFNIHKEYNEELANRLIESKAKINWGAYFSPSDMTFEDLKLYRKSGLLHVEFGSDSLSDSQLENYGKKFHFEDIKQQSEYCSRLNLFYAHYLILAGYGETEKSLNETFEHSKELGFTIFFPYIGMRIYPNTKICEIAINEGIIKSPNELINPVYYISKDIDAEKIRLLALKTGQRWVFADDKPSSFMEQLRKRGRKGLLWEYFRYG